jgi:5'-deoxynucleotidase YfbR-like HD superfamily hydrolase
MNARVSPRTPWLLSGPVEAFRPDGSIMDLAYPRVEEVDFVDIARALSHIPRFNGITHGVGYSVAQHCVMGAEALANEGADALTQALFLLHDAHEFYLGDTARPVRTLLLNMLENRGGEKAARALRTVWREAADAWDVVIYQAASLPPPAAWTNSQRNAVLLMDERMLLAESRALFGPKAAGNVHARPEASTAPPPKTRGKIKPWGAMEAEMRFREMFVALRSVDLLQEQHALHTAHATLFGGLEE